MKKIIAYGEVLWDIFEDVEKIGGAPFNFSAHLAKMDNDVYLATGIGDDELGYKTSALIKNHKINNKLIQINDYPTGKTVVTNKNNVVTYDIKKNTAYDYIDEKIIDQIKEINADAFYFGTLGQRNECSKNTLIKILEAISFKDIFCDINIRQDFVFENLELCLKYATILKISREELDYFKEQEIVTTDDYRENAKEIAKKYPKLKYIIITLDCDGAICYNCIKRVYIHIDSNKVEVVSPVGAGDSFSAAFLNSILKGENDITALEKANNLASFVVTKTEAVPMEV